MNTDQTLPLRAAEPPALEAPLEIGPWGLGVEPLLPAQHVVWASLALVVATLLVLAFG